MSGRGAYCAREARYSRACSTSASKSAASSLGLRVPLHADGEAEGRILDGFERAVRGPRRLDEAVADPPERLMVVRRHVGAGTDDRGEPRAVLDLDRMHGELAGNLLVLVAPDRLRKVLDEISPTRDVQKLERRGRSQAWACRARAPPAAAPSRRRRGAPEACPSRDAPRRRSAPGRRRRRRRRRSRRARRASPRRPPRPAG